MGNYLACSVAPKGRSSQSTRVILPTGDIRTFKEETKAAELMMECPNFFIVNSRSLNIGKRFVALSADEDLEFGNVYVMFQMRRLNSMVTAADMGMMFMAANSANKRLLSGSGVSGGSGGVKVCPEEEGVKVEVEEVGGLKLNLEEYEGFNFNAHRKPVCRSRKPGLETISEEMIH